ncbi:MAG: metalloregulator ArsR/SmtB family transcription factor [Pseudohongiella sp.]|nr:metalloregulator ArsR/SmtB family transcription factor [Pseudohongiella sp.]
MNVSDMRQNAGAATSLLKTLAHEDRLMLLCQLCEREMCVSELEQVLDIHQPSLSQQLGVLRREGLVETRRDGKHIYYRVSPGPALLILQQLHTIFCSQENTL